MSHALTSRDFTMKDTILIVPCLQIGGKKNTRGMCALISASGVSAPPTFFWSSNAELLQETGWDKVKLNSRRVAPKLPKWVWSHDPWHTPMRTLGKAVESIKKGIKIEYETDLEPRHPKSYKFEHWSIETITYDMRAGRPIDLGPGD